MPTCVAFLFGDCCVAMISTLHSVWLRPAVLGGFGGMSDRSLKIFHLFVSPTREAVGEGIFFYFDFPSGS